MTPEESLPVTARLVRTPDAQSSCFPASLVQFIKYPNFLLGDLKQRYVSHVANTGACRAAG